ncbi:MAG: acetolactate decarboxylase [Bacteroidota bacterium]
MIEAQKKPERNLHHFNFRTAFMSGFYEGEFTLSELLEKGDFGLGTFNNLQGEMIVLGGKVYRATADGLAKTVTDPFVKTPSAMVTFFKADKEIQLMNLNRDKLIEWITENLDTERAMNALKISGSFETLKARSQHPVLGKPFPEIEDVVKNMVYHDLENTEGTLVGFQLPPYLDNINYPGLHFHYVSNKSKLVGGCAPAFHIQFATLSVMKLHSFSVDVPQTRDYDKLKMNKDKNKVM